MNAIPNMSRRAFLKGSAASAACLWTAPALALTDEWRGQPYIMHSSREVSARLEWYGSSGGLTYFAPHNNEGTSVEAARLVMETRRGWLLHLVHPGERNISFVYEGVPYVFDPNRMFSDRGAERSLRDVGKTFSPEALGIVRGLAEHVISKIRQYLPPGATLIALHNNRNGAPLSINSYLPGGNYRSEAEAASSNPEIDQDDFFFVTERRHYDWLREAKQNVALQARNVADDGSLSVYCARRGIPYINVEAQRLHRTVQRGMIELLHTLLL